MSFKRDGDDTSLLNNLQRRRVGELLVSHIPEDEAVLLKNGRYSCTICYHRPIFDTLDMLAVHRKGKKHLLNLTRHLQQQQEIKDLKTKRIQEESIREANPTLPTTCNPQTTRRHGLLKAKPYNSCNKKRSKGKSSKFSRKETLDLDDKKTDIHFQSIQPTKLEAFQQTPSTKSLIKSYLKTVQKKKNFCAAVEKKRRQYSSLNLNADNVEVSAAVPSAVTATVQNCDTEVTPDQAVAIQEKKKRIEFFASLRQQGWKKDLSGKWVKDDDAEFDTDEEIPPEYPG